ncbi:MAG TPA: DUF262 domain-containing protein [Solidesulfovibrio sp.]|nr:DUF262 domain-containing protein [Solidesulfovibrio sp.]
MLEFEVSPLLHSSVLYIYSERDRIQIDPDYQRMSDVWPLEKRQLLIDSLINGFDIPKLYLQKFTPPMVRDGVSYRYAIIDGKQRLESIWKFIDGDFALSDDFVYLEDENVKLSGLTYADLARDHQLIKIRFDSITLPIIAIKTNDLDLIEDMFSRLNEAVPLNAAEKRNAFPGHLPKVIRKLALHRFFVDKVPFSNNRYRHYDIVTKFMYLVFKDGLYDTKKIHLDMYVRTKGSDEENIYRLMDLVFEVLNAMADVFVYKDSLLRSVGNITLYFWVFYNLVQGKIRGEPSRSMFIEFERVRTENRKKAEREEANYSYSLLEYDRLIQTPNDAYAMRFRFAVLMQYLKSECSIDVDEGLLSDNLKLD